jgi:hypothetical protein
MPIDSSLYGQRPMKRQKKDMSLSNSLDFKAQLSSLMSNSSATSAPAGRGRPSRAKEDISSHAKSKRRETESKIVLKEVAGTEEEAQELSRARRKMEEKARLYAAMKRGDYIPKDNESAPLVDFDRKWAEEKEGRNNGYSSSGTDNEEDEAEEMVEYEDEFGRLRQGTKADKEKIERRMRRGFLGAEELERMSARPTAPAKLIYGDAIQTHAFNPDDPEKMEELARKRDRSPTPPEMKHYDADWEIRDKGVGFYKFSKDEETRAKEMEALEKGRQETERLRKERDDKREARRREMAERRSEIEARRAKKMADSFLDGLASGMGDEKA